MSLFKNVTAVISPRASRGRACLFPGSWFHAWNHHKINKIDAAVKTIIMNKVAALNVKTG